MKLKLAVIMMVIALLMGAFAFLLIIVLSPIISGSYLAHIILGFGILLLYTILLTKIVVAPIKEITQNIERITEGDLEIKLEHKKIEEIDLLRKSLDRILASLKLAVLRTGATKDQLGLGEAIMAQKSAEKKFKTLFEGASDAIFVADAETKKLVDCNKEAVNLMGYSKNELLNMNAKQLHPEEVRERIMENFKKQIEGKLKINETKVLTKDGKEIPVEITAKSLKVDSKKRLVGIFRDISKRKNLQKKYKSYVENSPHGIFVTDSKGNYIEVNEAACKATGYSKEELLEKNIVDIVPKEERKKVIETFEKLKETGKLDTVIKYKKKNGEIGQWQVRAVKNSENKYLGFVTVLTKVKELKERYTKLLKTVSDVVYMLDLNKKTYSYVSPSIKEVLGYSVEEARKLTPEDILTESSFKKQKRSLTKALKEKNRSSEVLQLDAVHKDGHVVPLEVCASLIYGEKEKPVQLLGVARTVSKEKETNSKTKTSSKEKSETLEAKSYRELQKTAKELGIKANQKKEELIKKIKKQK